MSGEIPRHPLAGAAHGIDVHPVGAGAQDAPDPGGAEGEIPVEGVLPGFFIHGGKLRRKSRLLDAGQPFLILFLIVHCSLLTFRDLYRL